MAGAKAVSLFLSATMLLLGGLAAVQDKPLPPPQVDSAVGKKAPGFELADQDGQKLRLESLRGQPVLLIFYRGYW